MVTQNQVQTRAGASGLGVDKALGGKLWHFTRLRPA
jgi:hypothetical protein